MRVVNNRLLDELTERAKKSPRKRAHFLFHKHHEPVHRIVNAIEPGTYIPPHKHQRPDKIEAFIILRGKAAYLEFDDQGKIIRIHLVEKNGPILAVDIPPRIWHSFVSLKSGTVLFEVVQGPYNARTHKKFAPWAPKEENGKLYLKKLENEISKKKIYE